VPERLAHVDAIVMNGDGSPAPFGLHVFRMTMCGESFANLKKPQLLVPPSYFSGRDVHAVAAIGNPQRFFAHLKALGIAFTAHPFADHHAFTPADLAFGDAAVIIMTAKDGVKCERFANDRHWVLRVDASLDGDLTAAIMNKIGKPAYMDTKLLDILVCPICKGPLVYLKPRQELVCNPDRLAFPVRDGIPVMLEDEARKLTDNEKF